MMSSFSSVTSVLWLVASISLSFAQPFFNPQQTIPVTQNGEALSMPWFGGIHVPQIQTMDFNFDGVEDILIFDKQNSSPDVLIRSTWPSLLSYTPKPNYRDSLPPLRNWVILRDFDGDGVKDILTAGGSRILFYKNTSQQNTLSFAAPDTIVSLRSTGWSKIYVSSTDYPSIDDIDGDGDLDIVVFSIIGTRVDLHENTGSATAPFYELNRRCFGGFAENSVDNAVTLNDCDNASRNGSRHSGSTIAVYDYNGDGNVDVFLGDISFDNIVFLENVPDADGALMVSQDFNFPSDQAVGPPINIPVFPACYFIDVDADGDRDLVAAPNSLNDNISKNHIWLYENIGSDASPQFSFKQDDFLVEQMIDEGKNANVLLKDFDQDGLVDLFIATGEIKNGPNKTSQIAHYRNIGTQNEPAFALLTSDFAQLSALNIGLDISFDLRDADGDGDLDMVVGNADGQLFYFQSLAGAFSLNTSQFVGVDVGNNATPIFYDINQDGKIDVLAGERNGVLNYFENTSNSSTPFFELISEDFGQLSTAGLQFPVHLTPRLVEINSTPTLLLGTFANGLLQGAMVSTPTDSLDVTPSFQSFDYISKMNPDFADLNNDGMLDMIAGNAKGGVQLFRGTQQQFIALEEKPLEHSPKVRLSPNPSQGHLYLTGDDSWQSYSIVNTLGTTLRKGLFAQEIDVSNLPDGIYFLIIDFTQSPQSEVHQFILSRS